MWLLRNGLSGLCPLEWPGEKLHDREIVSGLQGYVEIIFVVPCVSVLLWPALRVADDRPENCVSRRIFDIFVFLVGKPISWSI